MIGELNWNDKRATIIGAGISGLFMGYYLKKKGFKVQILERSVRPGGLIQTKQTPFGPSETAAHSLLVTPEMKSFFDEIGVPLAPVHKNARARYIYRNGKMRRFPLTFLEALHILIRFFSRPRFHSQTQASSSKNSSMQNLSLADWCRAYLGEPALNFLLSPFVTGVFATAPDELNTSIAFPMLLPSDPKRSLFSHLRSLGKKPKSKPQMMAPVNGMQDFIEKLAATLDNEIQFNAEIKSLPESPNLILSIPTSELASLISGIDPSSSQLLHKLHYSPLVTVTAFYSTSAFTTPPRGVGVLIPRDQGLRILGVLFNSSAFPNRTKTGDQISLTVMLGGTQDPDALQLSDREISELIHHELSILLGAKEPSLHLEITRWKKAIPIYSSLLRETQCSLAQHLCKKPGLIVFSNFSKTVSIRGIFNALNN